MTSEKEFWTKLHFYDLRGYLKVKFVQTLLVAVTFATGLKLSISCSSSSRDSWAMKNVFCEYLYYWFRCRKKPKCFEVFQTWTKRGFEKCLWSAVYQYINVWNNWSDWIFTKSFSISASGIFYKMESGNCKSRNICGSNTFDSCRIRYQSIPTRGINPEFVWASARNTLSKNKCVRTSVFG